MVRDRRRRFLFGGLAVAALMAVGGATALWWRHELGAVSGRTAWMLRAIEAGNFRSVQGMIGSRADDSGQHPLVSRNQLRAIREVLRRHEWRIQGVVFAASGPHRRLEDAIRSPQLRIPYTPLSGGAWARVRIQTASKAGSREDLAVYLEKPWPSGSWTPVPREGSLLDPSVVRSIGDE